MRIDLIADVSCAWCAIELAALDQAMGKIGKEVPVTLFVQPFELNASLGPEGEDFDYYLWRKYQRTATQRDATRSLLRQHGEAVGFSFGYRTRIWNTRDAHRLIYWAGTCAANLQVALLRALLKAHHTHDRNPSSQQVLLEAAARVGLDPAAANAVIQSDRFANEVSAASDRWKVMGVDVVPTLILDNTYTLQGTLSPEAIELAIKAHAPCLGPDH
jgi:predicted DsbA family dithiol-disulfide isomerase